MAAPHLPSSIVGAAGRALARKAIVLAAQIVTGARPVYHFAEDEAGDWTGNRPLVFFANHRSHGDFVLLWSVLPTKLRQRTRPVAGADYWLRSRLRAFVGRDVFAAVLIERDAAGRTADPVEQMAAAVGDGASLILFPEGTRNTGSDLLLPFRTGLYHLADTLSRAGVAADFTPVWIDNLNRVLPKGEAIPVPLLCKVHFGAPLRLGRDEDKDAFLERARHALLALSNEDRGTRC